MANELKVILSLVDDFTTHLTGIETKMSTFGRHVDNMVTNIKRIGAAFAATFAVNQIRSMIDQSIEYGHSIERLSGITGLSTEKTQELDYVLKQAGSSLENMRRPLVMLSKEAYSNSAVFKTLGISVKDVNGNLKDSGTLFEETITRLADIQNTTERAALAQKIFGRGAGDVLAIIAQGKDKFQEHIDQTQKYGLILNEDTVRGLAAAKEKTELLKISFSVLGAEISNVLAPTVAKIAELFAKFLHNEFVHDTGFDEKKEQIKNIKQQIEGFKSTIADMKSKGLDKIAIFDPTDEKDSFKTVTIDQLISKIKVLKTELKSLQPPTTNPPGSGGEDLEKKIKDERFNKWLLEELEKRRKKEEVGEQKSTEWLKQELKKRQNNRETIDKAIENNKKNSVDRKIAYTENKYKQLMELEGATQEQRAALIKQKEQDVKKIKTDAALGAAQFTISTLQGIVEKNHENIVAYKALAMAEAAINTYLGATKALASVPPPWNFIQMAAVIAAGLAQQAKIASESFATGTRYAPGGWAMVGERGPELVNIPRGSQIFNNNETRSISNNSNLTVNIGGHGNITETMITEIRTGKSERLLSLIAQKLGTI